MLAGYCADYFIEELTDDVLGLVDPCRHTGSVANLSRDGYNDGSLAWSGCVGGDTQIGRHSWIRAWWRAQSSWLYTPEGGVKVGMTRSTCGLAAFGLAVSASVAVSACKWWSSAGLSAWRGSSGFESGPAPSTGGENE